MRLTVLANGDIESNIALNLLLRAFPQSITHVFLSHQVGGKSSAQAPQILQELKYIEQTFFQDIFFPFIEHSSSRASATRNPFLSFRQISNHHMIPVTFLNTPNTPEGHHILQSAQPDLVLSIRYGKILKFDALRIARFGVLNLHSGILPQYRGVLATFRALMNGDAEIGSTLHYITDPGIDTGPVIGGKKIPVRSEKSLFWHICQLYFSGTPLMCEAVEMISQKKMPLPQPQHSDNGRYYSFPTQEDCTAFHARGLRVADPTDIAEVAGYYI